MHGYRYRCTTGTYFRRYGSGSDRNVSLAHGLQLYDEIVRAHAPSYASASTALTAGTVLLLDLASTS